MCFAACNNMYKLFKLLQKTIILTDKYNIFYYYTNDFYAQIISSMNHYICML